MSIKNKATLPDELNELRRELNAREALYPDWVILGKIRKDVAQHRIECLKATIKRLEKLSIENTGQQTGMFDEHKAQT